MSEFRRKSCNIVEQGEESWIQGGCLAKTKAAADVGRLLLNVDEAGNKLKRGVVRDQDDPLRERKKVVEE
jgi:hypothetical protein